MGQLDYIYIYIWHLFEYSHHHMLKSKVENKYFNSTYKLHYGAAATKFPQTLQKAPQDNMTKRKLMGNSINSTLEEEYLLLMKSIAQLVLFVVTVCIYFFCFQRYLTIMCHLIKAIKQNSKKAHASNLFEVFEVIWITVRYFPRPRFEWDLQ